MVTAPDDARIKRRGRRIAAIVFLSFVSAWVLAVAAQITQQALAPRSDPSPYRDCREGMVALHGALVRARNAAEGDLDPESALRTFRGELDPEWTLLPGIRKTCTAAPELRSLDALERLRYAEEHAVRREAASLATLRRQVAADVAPR